MRIEGSKYVHLEKNEPDRKMNWFINGAVIIFALFVVKTGVNYALCESGWAGECRPVGNFLHKMRAYESASKYYQIACQDNADEEACELLDGLYKDEYIIQEDQPQVSL